MYYAKKCSHKLNFGYILNHGNVSSSSHVVVTVIYVNVKSSRHKKRIWQSEEILADVNTVECQWFYGNQSCSFEKVRQIWTS